MACTPDYINTCSSNIGASAPVNGYFYQYPRNGNGMIDMWMYDDETMATPNSRRAYLMGHLSTTLTAGQSYCVTFYVVLSNLRGGYAIDHIGAYMDDGSIDTNSHCGWVLTQYTPQVFSTTIIADTLHWTKIQGSFIANGMEKYITIGNFFDTAHTNKVHLTTYNASFYEVDDVSLIATGTQAYAGPDVSIYVGDTAQIGPATNGDGMPCYWYVPGPGGLGAPIDSTGTIYVHPTDTTTYVVMMDLCGVITYDTVVVNVVPCSTVFAAFTNTVTTSGGGSHTVGFTYAGTTFGVDSVKWTFGDGATSNAMNPSHTYTTTATYHVCVKVYTFCGVDSICSDVVGVGNVQMGKYANVEMFPNPTMGNITVEHAKGAELSVCDIVSGSAGLTMTIKSDKEVIDLSNLPRGIYIVQIVDGVTGERVVRKVVKE